MFQFLYNLYDLLPPLFFIFFIILLFLHVLISWFCQPTPLKLTQQSYVIIAGACTGIGKQMALHIAKTYHSTLLIIDWQKDLFTSLTQQLNNAGSVCHCYFVDLSDPASVQHLLTTLKSLPHKLSLFIYNAGIVIPKRTRNLTSTQQHLIMQVNYFTPIHILRNLQSQLADANGHFALVASMVSIILGGIDMAPYIASKHAINGYLCSARQQYKKDNTGVTISIAYPYAINTTMFKGFKLKLGWLIKVLDQQYVGKRLAQQFVKRKEMCFVYGHQAWIFRAIAMLPSQVIDWLTVWSDQSDFKGVRHRYDGKIEKSE